MSANTVDVALCGVCGVEYACRMLLRVVASGARLCAACAAQCARAGDMPDDAALEMRGAFMTAVLAAAALPPPNPIAAQVRFPRRRRGPRGIWAERRGGAEE